ncbi:unnamed protein product [Arctogadus glacialis]
MGSSPDGPPSPQSTDPPASYSLPEPEAAPSPHTDQQSGGSDARTLSLEASEAELVSPKDLHCLQEDS